MIGLHTFKDFYKNTVRLSFDKNPYSEEPWHVWVICKYGDEWLLTEHSERGLEFPGGKVEIGETAEEAAVREVMEETGAVAKNLYYVGQYTVEGRSATIVKNVYYVEVDKLLPRATYYETNGPVLLKTLPTNVKKNKAFSFIMKDDVLTHCLEEIEQKHKQWVK